jgi:hypothetical protein
MSPRAPSTMKTYVAAAPWTARCSVLGRARISFNTSAPCVVASLLSWHYSDEAA